MRVRVSVAMQGAAVDALAMSGLLLAIALLITVFGGNSWARIGTNTAITLTIVAALQIFSGNTGIVSFGHAGFVGIGAYLVGVLTMPAAQQALSLRDLPPFLAGHEMTLAAALAVTVVVGIAVGLISGAPLLRLTGAGASIATLALLIILYTLMVAGREITRGSQPFFGVPRGVGLWTAVPVAMAALVMARLFRAGGIGLTARAVAADEAGAAAVGIDRRVPAIAAWTLSIVLAMVAGGLTAQSLGAFSPHTFYFELAFTTLAMLIVGGMGSSLGAIAGVLATTLVIEFVRRLEGGIEIGGVSVPPIFGMTQAVLAIGMIAIIWRRPAGLVGGRELDLLRRLRRSPAILPASEPTEAATAPAIRAEHLTRRYAGVIAVDDVSIALEGGRITGIIGPNGAGKTTLIDMISGHTAASAGRLWIGGHTVDRPKAWRIARAGVGRTFQNIRIFADLSILENVVVAARRVEPDMASAEAAAMRELRRIGLDGIADRPAGTLPYGQRRRLEVARALALRPDFLILDEPAAGMNPVETGALMALLAEVRARRRIGIVLIEHDLRLVMTLCERVVVLDHGRVIADGTPADIQSDPAVAAAYLGRRAGARIRGGDRSKSDFNSGKGTLSHAQA